MKPVESELTTERTLLFLCIPPQYLYAEIYYGILSPGRVVKLEYVVRAPGPGVQSIFAYLVHELHEILR